jgi:hypothetical protein
MINFAGTSDIDSGDLGKGKSKKMFGFRIVHEKNYYFHELIRGSMKCYG